MFELFVEYKADLGELTQDIIKALEDSWHDYQVPTFTREIEQVKPEDYVAVASEYVTLVKSMNDVFRIEEIRREIKSLSSDISRGSKAWEDGDDECAMAECDPSDQYCKSMEIDELQIELNTLLVKPC